MLAWRGVQPLAAAGAHLCCAAHRHLRRFCLRFPALSRPNRPFQPRQDGILLITLGLSIIIDNAALFFFTGDTQTIDVAYAGRMVWLGPALVAVPKLVSFTAALAICLLLGLFITRTDMGKAIRAVAKERQGARLVGIDVEGVMAISFGIGIACLGAAACLLMPTFYVSPTSGHAFVLIAFTIVALGGMGSFKGALLGGLIIGVVESIGGLWLGEQLGQIGIPLVFIVILLLRPTGLSEPRGD
jgi:branched-chain amino acid transport system permease protein